MSGPIPLLPVPVPPVPSVTVSLPVPVPSVTLPGPSVSTTTPATIAPTSPTTPAAGPGPATTIQSPTSASASGTTSPSSANGSSTTTAPSSAECVEPSTTSTSSSTTAPDASLPDSTDAATSEPVVQLPPGAECEPPPPANTNDGASSSLPSGLTPADLETSAAAASLEQLLVNAYAAVREAAAGGSLGDVPPATGTYLDTAQTHHQAALDAWNEVLAGVGRPTVTASPLNLTVSVNEQFAVVTDLPGVAGVLSSLETTAAATYLRSVGTLQSARRWCSPRRSCRSTASTCPCCTSC